ncbi:uncharacterized protein LOC135394774 isoform X7 [Ornithodoros turicata]|uniref:uncharacterized protein LOC135394774 isoform X7 n=1 Tax=Ornithodoros turicata TaxID=34597 RepID=UPI003138670D
MTLTYVGSSVLHWVLLPVGVFFTLHPPSRIGPFFALDAFSRCHKIQMEDSEFSLVTNATQGVITVLRVTGLWEVLGVQRLRESQSCSAKCCRAVLSLVRWLLECVQLYMLFIGFLLLSVCPGYPPAPVSLVFCGFFNLFLPIVPLVCCRGPCCTCRAFCNTVVAFVLLLLNIAVCRRSQPSRCWVDEPGHCAQHHTANSQCGGLSK